MWAVSHLVPTRYAHGYGKFGNFPTSKYIALCHYTWRWLSTLDLKVWVRRLCLPPVDNIDYFGCDYGMCYFMCVKVFTFYNVVVGGPRWLDMEISCAQLCTIRPNVDGQIDPSLAMIHASLWCMLCGQSSRTTTMLFVISLHNKTNLRF
jgi:hypothetical protein